MFFAAAVAAAAALTDAVSVALPPLCSDRAPVFSFTKNFLLGGGTSPCWAFAASRSSFAAVSYHCLSAFTSAIAFSFFFFFFFSLSVF